MRPRVYTAGKLDSAPIFQALKRDYPQIFFTARWLDMVHLERTGENDGPDFTWFWSIDIRDVINSDYLIIYGTDNDVLRGALVEAGAALGNDIPVFIVGKCPSYGSWHNHPQAIHVDSLSRACDIILEWSHKRIAP